MAGGFRQEGFSGVVAEVDPDRNLNVALPQQLARAGYAVSMHENDDGTYLGAPYLKSPEVSPDFRLRTDSDTLLLSTTFNYSSQDFGRWLNYTSSGTISYGILGYVSLSAGALTANFGAMIRTSRVFPILAASALYIEWNAAYTEIPSGNNIMELGIGIPATAIGALTDGIVFRWDQNSVFQGVMTYNGVDIATTGTLLAPDITRTHKYTLVISTEEVEFWIDDVLHATVIVPAGYGWPVAEASLPGIARCYNYTGAAVNTQILKVAGLAASLGGYSTAKEWSHTLSSSGNNAAQGTAGMGSTGQTSNIVNSTVPATAALSNTVAGYTTLGGTFLYAAVAGSETDYALFAYLNPASAVALTARTLHITGISINTWMIGAAIATTPTILQWAIGFGATAVSLATTDTAATQLKAPRRVALGSQSLLVAALVGTHAQEINRAFTTPYCVNPGEYVHIILRIPTGTATGAQNWRGSVAIQGYWE